MTPTDLIAQLEAAREGSRELDGRLHRNLHSEMDWKTDKDKWWPCEVTFCEMYGVPHYTTSLDAALTLLPKTACNFQLFNFSGHGEDGFGEFAWGCGFMDRAQLMGHRAAEEEIGRLKRSLGYGRKIVGAPWVDMEKAISEHFIEFNCLCAATPALALCIAALRACEEVAEESHTQDHGKHDHD